MISVKYNQKGPLVQKLENHPKKQPDSVLREKFDIIIIFTTFRQIVSSKKPIINTLYKGFPT